MRRRGASAVALALAAAAAIVVPLAVDGTPTAAAAANPWQDAGYQPSPGNWRPYVLAPSDRDVPVQSVRSARPRGGQITGRPEQVLRADGKSVRLAGAGSRATSPLLTLDFGKEVAGKVEVRVAAASAQRPQLHVCFSESLRYAADAPGDNDGQGAIAPGCDTANIWNGFPGQPYTYDSDSHTLPLADVDLPATVTDTQLRGGFRYATLFLDGSGWVDIDAVSLEYTAAPLQDDPSRYRGWFLSNDNALNKIWYAGAYTVQVNTVMPDTAKSWPYPAGQGDRADSVIPHADPAQEVILDGGKRDRIVWQGDLAVQAPVTYLSTYDLPAVRNSLSSLAAQQLDDGYMPAESQVGQHNRDELRTYGEYVTWFVNNLYEYWLTTADRSYLDQWYPALTKATAWLESVRAQDHAGLIGFGAVGSCGHYGYSDCGHETYVNALYARNLDQMAALATVQGDAAGAAAYQARAKAVRDAVNAQLWDDQVGAYRLSRETPGAYPQDANATAVLTGVADTDRATRALSYLRRTSWGPLGALTVSPRTPNPSLPSFYAPLPSGFEATARLRATDPAGLGGLQGLDLIRTFWGWQLAQDPGTTFWEHVQPDGTPNLKQFSSLAHGWASGPTVTLTQDVLGVAPTGAGYAGYDVVPHPGDLSWAQGSVPTPHGDLTASWTAGDGSFTLDVTAPTGTTGRLAVPTSGAKVQVTMDGRPVWDGSRALADGVTADDSYVYVSAVAAGRHRLQAQRTGAAANNLAIVVTSDTTAVQPGDIVHVTAVVSGTTGGRLTGTVTASGPDGWPVSPANQPVDIASGGRPAYAKFDFYAVVPANATSGSWPVTVTARAAGLTATGVATLRLQVTRSLYDFEDGTQGWQAGQNATSVARVTGFANGPGRPFGGEGALEVVAASSPASSWKTAVVSPASPLDLSTAATLLAHIDAYGGAPGASGYEAIVNLTGAGGDTLSKTLPMSADSWNELNVDIGSWAGRQSVSRIEVGFRAVGSATTWLPRFQLDAIAAVG